VSNALLRRPSQRIAANPSPDAAPSAQGQQLVHCHAEAPPADELHALCRHLLADPLTASYGAQLMFCALTGLRPGEPGFLRLDAAPGQPGSRSTRTVDGQTFEVIHIRRLKSGINPAVRVHPALADFLRAWFSRPSSILHPPSSYYFPHPKDPARPCVPAGNAQGSFLDKALKRAALACGVTANRRPHAMRAYYVRVRRSMGASDSIIASERASAS
jgi:integrase